jgi:hypothetical protein
MALTEERYFRMAKRACFYDRGNKQPIEGCYFKINDCKIDDKVDMDPFTLGGDQVANAAKGRTFTLSFTAASYRNEAYEQLAKAEVTDIDADASGEIYGFDNFKGTSVKVATTGIASITITDATELKEGMYVIVATDTAKCKVYAFSDLQLADGTMIQPADDSMMIDSEKTITTAGNTAVTSMGITLDGGSGTIGFTTGDSALFYVRRADVVGEEILVTGATDFDEIGIMLFPDHYNGEYTMIDCFKVTAGGLPIEIKDTWSTYQISTELLKDETEGGYYRIHRNRPE